MKAEKKVTLERERLRLIVFFFFRLPKEFFRRRTIARLRPAIEMQATLTFAGDVDRSEI